MNEQRSTRNVGYAIYALLPRKDEKYRRRVTKEEPKWQKTPQIGHYGWKSEGRSRQKKKGWQNLLNPKLHPKAGPILTILTTNVGIAAKGPQTSPPHKGPGIGEREY